MRALSERKEGAANEHQAGPVIEQNTGLRDAWEYAAVELNTQWLAYWSRQSPTPEPTPETPTPGPQRAGSGHFPGGADVVRGQFIQGFLDAGGPTWALEHFLSVVIPCESGWQPGAVSPGGHLGLVQFAEESWLKVSTTADWATGLTDWSNPYHQGVNTAVWFSHTTPSSQWSCW